MAATSFEYFPAEILLEIFSYLDPISLKMISECCKAFKDFTDKNMKPEQWGLLYARMHELNSIKRKNPRMRVFDLDMEEALKVPLTNEIRVLSEMGKELKAALSELKNTIQLDNKDLLKFKKSITKQDYNTFADIIAEIKSYPKTSIALLTFLVLLFIYGPGGIAGTIYLGGKIEEQETFLKTSPAYIWGKCKTEPDKITTQSDIDTCKEHLNIQEFYANVFLGFILSSVMVSSVDLIIIFFLLGYLFVPTDKYTKQSIDQLTPEHAEEWKKIKQKLQFNDAEFNTINDIVNFINTHTDSSSQQDAKIQECQTLITTVEKELKLLHTDSKSKTLYYSPYFKDGLLKTKLALNVNHFFKSVESNCVFDMNIKIKSDTISPQKIDEETPLLNTMQKLTLATS